MAKILITVSDLQTRALNERADRMTSTGALRGLSPLEQSVLFLRAVHSRAVIGLTNFYLFYSTTDEAGSCLIEGYPGIVFKHSIGFSSLSTLALVCRKAFDHGAKGLTGANFAKTSDATLHEHAGYWAAQSKRPDQDAYNALCFLRSVFRDCAKTDTALFKGAGTLGQRIGLVKQYADRHAAHLSMEGYEVATIDCMHVVAALTLIGEIVRSFDDPSTNSDYFDTVDEASFIAAKTLFPMTLDTRLFNSMKIEVQARMCWKTGGTSGRELLFEELPHAIGWF